ncbi:Putative zinc-finger [Quadrisphaera granulorum]|uniref:Putative zinc finger protein n=1 Tax=Quadrisphaera granulorum TaxID=317664 RepID=A0A315ZZX5_9ACTN|nr:zf-HC2 domain-containing protein [Quadrisphaera granulorum]PWJ51141.1 putative zinc finger protein [Quadrisphaera granulorum]SZE97791.1 Putative zinc-finger [Quadrisphaera granulorum]
MSAPQPQPQSQPSASPQPWHASPALLVAYTLGRLSAADAWSAEAHLVSCPSCRAELGRIVDDVDDTRDVLALARTRVLSQPPPAPAAQRLGQRAASAGLRRAIVRVGARSGAPWHLRWVVRPASLGAVALAVAAATAFAGISHVVVGATNSPTSGTAWLLWLLAPAVPVAGVALSGLGAGDELELELATPSAGWRLVLWRALAVVVTAVPLALLAGWVTASLTGPAPPGLVPPGTSGVSGAWLPVLWLLPALALTATALALGTWLVLWQAAAVVGVVWLLVVGVPSLVLRTPSSSAVGSALDSSATPFASAWVVHLISGWAQPVWLLVLAAAVVVVVVRRDAFGTVKPSLTARWTTGGGEA